MSAGEREENDGEKEKTTQEENWDWNLEGLTAVSLKLQEDNSAFWRMDRVCRMCARGEVRRRKWTEGDRPGSRVRRKKRQKKHNRMHTQLVRKRT